MFLGYSGARLARHIHNHPICLILCSSQRKVRFHSLTKYHLESHTYLSVGVPSRVLSPARPKETLRRNDRPKEKKIDTSAIILRQPTVPEPHLSIQVQFIFIFESYYFKLVLNYNDRLKSCLSSTKHVRIVGGRRSFDEAAISVRT